MSASSASGNVRLERLERFLRSAATLCEPSHRLYHAAREQLRASTGLSNENVAWALDNALELDPADWDLQRLCERTPQCQRAHVLLSANVFVAALRAIAIAVAAAPEVHIRPSRREPLMVELLARAAPGQFKIVERLQPWPGDHVWAYGSDETLAQLRQTLAETVVVHEHGSGYGVIVVRDSELRNQHDRESIARAIIDDTVPFDQRGCLSPRVVVVERDRLLARALWQSLAVAMTERERQIPIGMLSDDERAEILRYRDTLCVAGEVLNAGNGLVSFEAQSLPWILPPIGRILHVRTSEDAIEDLKPEAAKLTTIGLGSMATERVRVLQRAFPHVRIAELGRMQRPRLDGPVDLRSVHSFD